ncbi:unnamed protein product, partial [marine sediment metagenome]
VLLPDEFKDIRVEITPSGLATGVFTTTYITLISKNYPTLMKDLVVAKTYVYPSRPDAAVGVPSGTKDTWLGDDVWYPPDEQKTITDTTKNTWLTYYVQIQNDGASADTITVTGTAGGSGWTISYYHAITGDITADMNNFSAGWSTGSLGSGESEEIWVEIVASNTVAGGSTKEITIWCQSNTLITQTDQVRIDVAIQQEYKSDLHVKQDTDPSYTIGLDEYYPETQGIVVGVPVSGTTTTYYVRLENDGNAPDSLVITGIPTNYLTKFDDWNWEAPDNST